MSTLFSHANYNDRAIAIWLIVIAMLIYGMVILGGVTRLTGSGLSMVEWEPIMGVIPPLNETEWQETFDKYKQFPEYQKINYQMSLEEFKGIFIFEYGHRVLGRFIGLMFLLPFLYFLSRRMIRPQLIPKLILMFILGGLQGVLGWYMVKSGLVDDPRVSQYRLTAHLVSAMIIYAYVLWTAWSLFQPVPRNSQTSDIARLRQRQHIITALVLLMIISGAFVAGTDAGVGFNTFPLMNGYVFPPGLMAISPAYLNFFENPVTIQFTHRMLAYLLLIAIPYAWLKTRRIPLAAYTRTLFHLLLVMLLIQVSLGISTLLWVVPVPLAAAHQGGALLLLTVALYLNHELRKSAQLH